MKKSMYLLLAVLAAFAACKKDKKTNPGNPGDGDSTQIVTPVDPATAASQGLFLNDWAAKSYVSPALQDAAKPASASISITVDAANVVSKVSKYLFGNNANPYIGQVVTEPVLMNHLKNLSPTIIRFPGGNLSSVYFWSAASDQKPADAPSKLYNEDGDLANVEYWYGKNTASWTLSLDNYYNLLQQTNSTGIITVNYGYARYGTSANPVSTAAHLAADWVRHDNGRTKFWEIGNESNGTWQAGYKIDVAQNKDGQPEIITGELYGKHFKVFADSMKKAAQEIGKTIYIGAQLLQEAPASWATATDKSWNQGVLSQAGNTADYYIIHSYYTPFNTNSTAADILTSATAVTKNMMDYLKQNIQANGAPLKPVALTEWNIFAVGSQQMVSNIAGLHAAMVLGELIKNNYGMASRWDIANSWDDGNDHGMFNAGDEPNAAKWNPRPAFYYMYYFQKTFGDRMVASEVKGNADIVSYASTFSSGEAGLVIVNKGTAAHDISIDMKNFAAGSKFQWYALNGGSSDFSRKVMINGAGPSGVSGGPANYAELAANSASTTDGIRVSVPARGAVFLVIEGKK